MKKLIILTSFLPLLSLATTVYQSTEPSGVPSFSATPSKDAKPVKLNAPDVISLPKATPISNQPASQATQQQTQANNPAAINEKVNALLKLQMQLKDANDNLATAQENYNKVTKQLTAATNEYNALVSAEKMDELRNYQQQGQAAPVSQVTYQQIDYTKQQLSILQAQHEDVMLQMQAAEQQLQKVKNQLNEFMTK